MHICFVGQGQCLSTAASENRLCLQRVGTQNDPEMLCPKGGVCAAISSRSHLFDERFISCCFHCGPRVGWYFLTYIACKERDTSFDSHVQFLDLTSLPWLGVRDAVFTQTPSTPFSIEEIYKCVCAVWSSPQGASLPRTRPVTAGSDRLVSAHRARVRTH